MAAYPPIEIGKAKYSFYPANLPADKKALLKKVGHLFTPTSRVVYFWDCETQTGIPSPPRQFIPEYARYSTVVFDKSNGKILDSQSRENTRLHYLLTNILTKRAFSRAIAKALPIHKPKLPFATHINPFKKDYMFKVVMKVDRMIYVAHLDDPDKKYKGRHTWFWVLIPWKISFTTTLIKRCDGKKIVLEDGWDPKVESELEHGEYGEELIERYNSGIEEEEGNGG